MRIFLGILSVISLLIVTFIGWHVVAGVNTSELELENYVGMPFEEAGAKLTASGLVPRPEGERGPEEQVGKVLRMEPPAGSRVKAGRLVFLYYGEDAAMVEVPEIVGLRLVDAMNALRSASTDPRSAGLGIGTTENVVNDSVPLGTILEQRPTSGTQVKAGSLVNVSVVVSGEGDLMPSLVNLTLAEAQETLAIRARVITSLEKYYNTKYPPGTVMSQKPPPGTQMDPDLAISVTVAEVAPGEVPELELSSPLVDSPLAAPSGRSLSTDTAAVVFPKPPARTPQR